MRDEEPGRRAVLTRALGLTAAAGLGAAAAIGAASGPAAARTSSRAKTASMRVAMPTGASAPSATACLFLRGYPKTDGRCPAGNAHSMAGYDFVLPHL
ncbi:hypothetical protein [Streptomyces sp. NPDC005423]|uniref:hypothetical protein n=1 Tax=Streptomyces sp. NPDC005423 TaxID=3155343 RepID=UPI00339EBE9C